MRILIVKTTSMGDIIHAMPSVVDLASWWQTRHPTQPLEIDWLVEESFVELPQMLPVVSHVYPLAMRRWRKQLFKAETWREIRSLRRLLQSRHYDIALDLQGLIKSAIWVRMSGAKRRFVMDRTHARESVASYFYSEGFEYEHDQHAIERLRSVTANAMHYSVSHCPRFGIQLDKSEALPWNSESRYGVMLFATSRADKQWPEDSWVELGTMWQQDGVTPILVWGSSAEKEQAERIAAKIPTARVAERMNLREAALLLKGAVQVVGVDTGLTHLACAIGCPVVALFSATPAWRFGPYWSDRQVSLGGDGEIPSVPEVYHALEACRAAS